MRGILDEPTLRLHPSIEPVEHGIERVGKVSHLVGRTFEMDATREVGRLDVTGDLGDPADRADHPTRRPPNRCRGRQAPGRAEQEREGPDRLEGLLAHGLLDVQERVGGAGPAAAVELGDAQAEDPRELVLERRRAAHSGPSPRRYRARRSRPSTSTPAVTSRAAVTISASRNRIDRTEVASRPSGDAIHAGDPRTSDNRRRRRCRWADLDPLPPTCGEGC